MSIIDIDIASFQADRATSGHHASAHILLTPAARKRSIAINGEA
jgi:hypothetical protein